MKKPIAIFLVFTLILSLVGCANKTDTIDTPEITNNSSQAYEDQTDSSISSENADNILPVNTDEAEMTSIHKWTEEEIISLFKSKDENENQDISDCVVFPDFATECIGAVLLYDNEKQMVTLAFIDEEGYYQEIGIMEIIPCSESNFTYLGDGAVTFQCQTEEGVTYNYKMTYSRESNGPMFIAESDFKGNTP